MTSNTKPRPAVLRALGKSEPPVVVTIDGEEYVQQDVFKHDSWAATAFFEGQGEGVVCKFNRVQSIFGLSTRWLGSWLASREAFAYERLSGIPGIIPGCGAVYSEGKELKNAVAHRFVPGHPLGESERVDDAFFPALYKILQAVHAKGFAYVDLHKRENILVDEAGKPYLIDFQISFYASRKGLFWPFTRPILNLLQQSDLYHFCKHVKRLRPDQLESLQLLQAAEMPWWIRLHRQFAVPFRLMRRNLLVMIGVRGKSGRSSSEVFAEHAFRCEQKGAA